MTVPIFGKSNCIPLDATGKNSWTANELMRMPLLSHSQCVVGKHRKPFLSHSWSAVYNLDKQQEIIECRCHSQHRHRAIVSVINLQEPVANEPGADYGENTRDDVNEQTSATTGTIETRNQSQRGEPEL